MLCCTLQGTILKLVDNLLSLEKGDPARETAVADVRSNINKWVAKYRRANVQGKPSFGCALPVCANGLHPRCVPVRSWGSTYLVLNPVFASHLQQCGWRRFGSYWHHSVGTDFGNVS